MAMVAGGVNFCSIARDLRIPTGLLPFTRIFETILEGDRCFDFLFLFFTRTETSGTEISIFLNSLFQILRYKKGIRIVILILLETYGKRIGCN